MIRLDQATYDAHQARVKRDPTVLEIGFSLPAKPSKMRNRRIETVEGAFDSVKELTRYRELVLMQRAGVITGLQRQVKFALDVNGVHICNYWADMVYFEGGARVVIDVKPTYKSDAARKAYQATDAYRRFKVKKLLMLAVHGITVVEV